jgi:hypothetical protein
MSVTFDNSHVSTTFVTYIYPPNKLKDYTSKNHTATNWGLMTVTIFKSFILVVFGCILSIISINKILPCSHIFKAIQT